MSQRSADLRRAGLEDALVVVLELTNLDRYDEEVVDAAHEIETRIMRLLAGVPLSDVLDDPEMEAHWRVWIALTSKATP